MPQIMQIKRGCALIVCFHAVKIPRVPSPGGAMAETCPTKPLNHREKGPRTLALAGTSSPVR